MRLCAPSVLAGITAWEEVEQPTDLVPSAVISIVFAASTHGSLRIMNLP